MNTIDKKQNRMQDVLTVFCLVFIFVLMYKYALYEIGLGDTDLCGHMENAQNIYMNRLKEAWLARPYFIWHLSVKIMEKVFGFPIENAAAFIHACFGAFGYCVSYFIIYKISSHISKADTQVISTVVALMVCLVQPLYVAWFNITQYEGQYSPNPLFNPTQMAVKPVGMLAFAVAVDLIRRYKGKEPLFFSQKTRLYVLFAGLLFLSVLVKPTFMYMLVPAGVLYYLIELGVGYFRHNIDIRKWWDLAWRTACACIPALCYLILEFCAFYFWGGTNEDSKIAIYPLFTVWKIFSPNILISILLAMGFPIWMLITNWSYFGHSVEGRLSVIAYVVGTAEFSIFVETGSKMEHCNFSWEMMSGMALFWVVAAARLIAKTASGNEKTGDRVVLYVSWALLFIFFFSGLYFLSPDQYLL